MHRVVAVLHVHAAPVAELHRDRHRALRLQAIHVLASALRVRHVVEAAVAREDLPFLEVDVNRMIPPVAVVDEMPDLPRPELRRRRDPVVVGGELDPAVGPDAPMAGECGDRIAARLDAVLAEHERPLVDDRNLRQIRIRDHHVGHLALVGHRRIAHDAELEEASHARIVRLPRQRLRHRQLHGRLLSVQAGLLDGGMIGEVHEVQLVADLELREVDHDVEAFGDAHLFGLELHHRTRQQVAVVGNEGHRLREAGRVGEPELEEPRHGRVQHAEAVLAPLDLEVRLVGEIHRHHVAHEAVELEDVEVQLPVGVERLVGEHQVHVVIEVAEVLRRAARQPQVDAVVDRLVAAIEAAVDVEHRGVALVHVLRREAEHVIVEPVRAHRLVPVARHFDEAAAAVGRARHDVVGLRVDAVVPGEHDRPVVVVELAREEIRAREAVVLRAVMAVVLVRRDRVAPEAAVLRHVGRQAVVVAEDQRLAVARLHELRRNRAVERPHARLLLNRQIGMEAQRQRRARAHTGVQVRRHAGVVHVVRRRRQLRRGDVHLRRVLAEPLVRPDGTRRPSFDRPGAAAEERIDDHLRLIRCGRRERIRAGDRLARQHVEARHRLRVRLAVEQRARRRARRPEHLARHRHERTQPAFRRQRAGAGEQAPLDEIASRDAAPRQLPDDLGAVSSRALRIPHACLRGIARQKDTHGVPTPQLVCNPTIG